MPPPEPPPREPVAVTQPALEYALRKPERKAAKQPEPPKAVMAVRLQDGTVIPEPAAKNHIDVVEKHGIDPDAVKDTGFLIGGKYTLGLGVGPAPEWAVTAARQEGYDLRPGTATGAKVGAAPAEPRPRGERWVGKAAELTLAPEEMQFRTQTDKRGMHKQMAAAKKFNPRYAKDLTLWRDPNTAQLKVVNGHNRAAKALEQGYAGNLEGDIIPPELAPDIKTARLIGALENIAEGHATPLDAAKVFRDGNLTAADLEREGISLEGPVAKQGLGIAALDDNLYRLAWTGQLSEDQAAMIGRELPDHAMQRAILPAITGGELSNKELTELIRQTKQAPVENMTQETLFGTEQRAESLAVPKAKVGAYILDRLGKEKRAFKAVTQTGRPELLKGAGNVIQEEASKARALGAEQLSELYSKLSAYQGPVSDILNDAARRVARGEEPEVVKRDAYKAVIEELRKMPGVEAEGMAAMGAAAAAEAPPPQMGMFTGKPTAATKAFDRLRDETGGFTIGQGTADTIREVGKQVGQIVSPTSFATDEALNALVGAKGEEIEQMRFLYNKLSAGNEGFFDRLIGKQGITATRDFLQRMSTGQAQATPELQKMADFYRHQLDAAALGASKFKTVPYREDYIPGIWKDPEAAEKIMGPITRGRRPMGGSGAFLRKKLFQEFQDGIAAGLEPIDENPEVLIRTYLEDVRRFNYAHNWFNTERNAGRLWWRRADQPLKEGEGEIQDRITQRFFPPDKVPVIVKGTEIRRILNEYSRRIRRERTSETVGRTSTTTESAPGAAATPAGKIEERVREALSARGFQAGEVEQYINRLKAGKASEAQTIIREVTDRVKRIERTEHIVFALPEEIGTHGRVATQKFTPAGRWVTDEHTARLVNNSLSQDFLRQNPATRGFMWMNAGLNAWELLGPGFHTTAETFNAWATKSGHAMSAAVRGKPLTALGELARVPTAPLEYLYKGMRAWNDPMLTTDALSPLRHGAKFAAPTGAFRPGSAWDAFMKNMRRREYLPAVARAPFAAIDGMMKPLFSFLVPRMEAGAYLDVLGHEIQRNPMGDRATQARQAWESVQNRMGMVNYDTWFWHNSFKAAMQMLWRAPGWNFGFAREFARAGYDLAKGKGFTPPLQYWFGLLFAQVSAAALYQYLHTGKGIESFDDVLAPRNGEKDAQGNEIRVRFPNALKDFYGATHHPGELLQSKVAPMNDLFVQLYNNRDYWGDLIYTQHHGATWEEWAKYAPEQARDVGRYLTEELRPFSVQQYQRLSERPSPQAREAFLGIIKAPREMIESPEERQLRTLLESTSRAQGPRTPQQKRIDNMKAKARAQLEAGDPSGLRALIQAGILKDEKAVRHFLKQTAMTPQQRLLQRLPQALRSAPPPQ